MCPQDAPFELSGSRELGIPAAPEEVYRLWKLIAARKITDRKIFEKVVSRVRLKYGTAAAWWINILFSPTGPLEPLLRLKDVEEIFIDGEKPIYLLLRNGKIIETGIRILSREYFIQLINNMLLEEKAELSISNPKVSGKGIYNTRVTAVIAPFTEDFAASIRKFPESPLKVKELIETGFLDLELLGKLLSAIFTLNGGLMIAGTTGSGKTTLLGVIAELLPEEDRIVIVENFPEIPLKRAHTVHLLGRGRDLAELIYTALRMRPDWLIVGEVRSNEEVKALEQALLSNPGYGVLFTYHAESIKAAFERLKVQGMEEYAIKEIKVAVLCKRMREKGKARRKVLEVREGGKKKLARELLEKAYREGRIEEFVQSLWKEI